MDLRVQGEVGEAKGELPAIIGAFSRQFRDFELVENFGRDLLRRVTVIVRKLSNIFLSQGQFSSICEGASTKSPGTLVPEKRANWARVKMACMAWPNSWNRVTELVGVIAPVPQMNFRLGIARFFDFKSRRSVRARHSVRAASAGRDCLPCQNCPTRPHPKQKLPTQCPACILKGKTDGATGTASNPQTGLDCG
jgi:hypothetical protein